MGILDHQLEVALGLDLGLHRVAKGDDIIVHFGLLGAKLAPRLEVPVLVRLDAVVLADPAGRLSSERGPQPRTIADPVVKPVQDEDVGIQPLEAPRRTELERADGPRGQTRGRARGFGYSSSSNFNSKPNSDPNSNSRSSCGSGLTFSCCSKFGSSSRFSSSSRRLAFRFSSSNRRSSTSSFNPNPRSSL